MWGCDTKVENSYDRGLEMYQAILHVLINCRTVQLDFIVCSALSCLCWNLLARLLFFHSPGACCVAFKAVSFPVVLKVVWESVQHVESYISLSRVRSVTLWRVDGQLLHSNLVLIRGQVCMWHCQPACVYVCVCVQMGMVWHGRESLVCMSISLSLQCCFKLHSENSSWNITSITVASFSWFLTVLIFFFLD